METIIGAAIGLFFLAIVIDSRRATLRVRRQEREAALASRMTSTGKTAEELAIADKSARSSNNDAVIKSLISGCGWLSLLAAGVVLVGALLRIGWNLF